MLHYQLILHFFDPNLTTDGKYYKPLKYRQIIEKMMVITMLSEHSITFSEVDNMPLLDRDFVYEKLKERQEAIKKQHEEMLAKQKAQRNNK